MVKFRYVRVGSGWEERRKERRRRRERGERVGKGREWNGRSVSILAILLILLRIEKCDPFCWVGKLCSSVANLVPFPPTPPLYPLPPSFCFNQLPISINRFHSPSHPQTKCPQSVLNLQTSSISILSTTSNPQHLISQIPLDSSLSSIHLHFLHDLKLLLPPSTLLFSAPLSRPLPIENLRNPKFLTSRTYQGSSIQNRFGRTTKGCCRDDQGAVCYCKGRCSKEVMGRGRWNQMGGWDGGKRWGEMKGWLSQWVNWWKVKGQRGKMRGFDEGGEVRGEREKRDRYDGYSYLLSEKGSTKEWKGETIHLISWNYFFHQIKMLTVKEW